LAQLGAHMPASTTSHILLGGLVASRFGLWLFDLAVSQMLQDWVPAEDIGKLPAKAFKAFAITCYTWPHWKQLLALHQCSMRVHGLALMLHKASVLCLVSIFPGQCNPEQQPFATCHVECKACHDKLVFLSVLISCFRRSATRAALHAIQAC